MNHETPTDDDLHAYVDGHLPPARRAAVEAWLAANPARADEVRGWKRDADRLRALLAQPEAWPANPALDPARLRQRLRARRTRGLAMAASLLVALGVGGLFGWQARALQSPAPLPMADAVAAYRQFVDADAPPMEFDAARAAELEAWLARNFGDAGRVPDLSPAGYSLQGGRLLSTEQGPAAMLVYADADGARVGFYLRPRGRLAGDGERRDGELLARYWSREDLSFAVVSAAADPSARWLPALLDKI